MSLFKRFIRLPGKSKWLLIESIVLLALARVAVAMAPFSTLQSWVTRTTKLKTRRNFSREEIGWAVSRASRFVPRSTCLAEALATQVLLSRAGYASMIRVGIRKREDAEFTAHAWVESEGKVIAGGKEDVDKYEPMSVFVSS